MKIKSLHISAFGKLKDKEITFGDNLNIIYGRNESGKSTISAFIEAMLYSFPPRSDREKYFPWDNSTPSGTMIIEEKNESITIYRKFGTTPKGDFLEVTPPVDLNSFMPKSRDSYRKGVYCAEGAAKDFGTSSEIDSKIANIMATGDEALDATAAIERLEKLRRSLKPKKGSGGRINEVEGTITMLENELSLAHGEAKQIESARNILSQKESALEQYNERLKLIEGEKALIDSSRFDKTDSLIQLQREYIAQFPQLDRTPPKPPLLLTKSLLLYIICALVPFIIGFMLYLPVMLLAPVPILLYFVIYGFKKRAFRLQKQAFLTECGCLTLDEYEKMRSDKKEAVDYLNTLLKEKSDLADPAAFYAKLQAESNSIYKEMLGLKDEVSQLKDELSGYKCRSVDAIGEDLAYYRTLRDELAGKLAAIDAAIAAIEHAKYRISKDFTPHITQIAMEYLNRIAPKAGRQVTLSTDFTLSLTDPVRQDISSCSFGFKEEMYLCFRIALSQFVYGNNLPLILDDPFIGSDSYREKAIADLLYSISENRQVIVFTNRQPGYFSQLNCNWVDITPSDDV